MAWFRRKRSGSGGDARRGDDGAEAATESAPVGDAPDPRTPWPEQPVPDDPHAAAAEFWSTWAELLPHLSAALGEGDTERAENLLVEPVAAVHPGLQFSVDRGSRAIYALVVSSREDPELRPYTDAWREAAPPEDAIWEFHDSVPPVPDPAGVAVNFAGQRFDLGAVRVVAQVDDDAGLVDVAVHHPLLCEVDHFSRTTMTFLPLDVTLGERLAAQRLRRVETAVAEPDNAITLTEFRGLVRELAGLPADDGVRDDPAAGGAADDDTAGGHGGDASR
ncbi:hypothetical protein LY13_003196 [Prauserella aidingensis]|uniref:hypothetical protein n=1 Tax=Prauserella aidingensis TaxID=387890 RepID=UPI0020A49102|nr:hypothetical protein [Prauserella aidingensis]MCP2254427.1 hypothetical protein [Prauserella aidingensis]